MRYGIKRRFIIWTFLLACQITQGSPSIFKPPKTPSSSRSLCKAKINLWSPPPSIMLLSKIKIMRETTTPAAMAFTLSTQQPRLNRKKTGIREGGGKNKKPIKLILKFPQPPKSWWRQPVTGKQKERIRPWMMIQTIVKNMRGWCRTMNSWRVGWLWKGNKTKKNFSNYNNNYNSQIKKYYINDSVFRSEQSRRWIDPGKQAAEGEDEFRSER